MEIKDLCINDIRVITSNRGMCRITIEWSANIGFGEYDLYYEKDENKWTANSECMDKGEDKEFLKALLEKFVENVEVIS